MHILQLVLCGGGGDGGGSGICVIVVGACGDAVIYRMQMWCLCMVVEC